MKTINSDGTFLFDQVIFGPINSRRLGKSLGVNLLPSQSKLCNFSCNYCECGWSENKNKPTLPSAELVIETLISKLDNNQEIDYITLAGNGEPTTHPQFNKIVSQIIETRNRLAPETKISVLTNGTMLYKESVKKALSAVDQVQIKLDTGLESSFIRINRPSGGFSLDKLIKQINSLTFDFEIQSIFLDGNQDGISVGNSSDLEIRKWLKLIYSIYPSMVHIYTIDRETPQKGLLKVSNQRLKSISDQVNKLGISAKYY
ncbi:MAG: radical SAM protein [Flavobacteriales bacterium]|nr:radical SAM protein [Flavobacteriales bacterium]